MKSILKAIFAVFAITFGMSITSFAAEKEVKVDLSEGYTQANFYFAFEYSQDYDIVITNPAQEQKQYTIMGDSGTVTIDNIIAGTYTISIKASESVDFKSSPRVELLKNSVDSSHGNISVSSNVSGLKIWFEDGVLKAKWDDTNIGRVNIQIKNPSTMEVIANSTVEGVEYSTKLASDIDTINFYIVPASSSKISGAGSSYSVKVIKDVPGDIIFGDKNLYNTNIYDFKAVLYGNTTITVLENGSEVFSQLYKEAGEYDIEVPLNDLDNNMVVYVIDGNGNLNSYKTSITKDIIAPKFTIQSIDTITKKSEVEIIGIVTETNVVTINGYDIETNQNGQFQYIFPLEVGDNKIEVKASDVAGNEAVNNYLVTRVEVNYMPVLVIFALIILSALSFFAVKKFKNTSKKKKANKNDAPGNDEDDDDEAVKSFDNKGKTLFTAHKLKFPFHKTSKEKAEGKMAEDRKASKKENNKDALTYNLIVKRNKNQIIGNLIALGVFTVCLLVLFTKVIMFTTVLSGSMEPTLKTGDKVIYNRLAYTLHDIERGDIVCFYSDEHKEYFGKRVIGIGGDEVSFADGYLLINGEKVEESYIGDDVESNSHESFTVPQNTVFLLGDNRGNSNDSRFWDNPFISTDKISGKYIGKISLP